MKIARRVSFLTEYAEQKDGDEFVIPEDLSTLSMEDLHGLKGQATDYFNTVYGDGTNTFTEEDVALLSALTDGIETVQTAIGDREAANQVLATQARELAVRDMVEDEEVELDENGDPVVPEDEEPATDEGAAETSTLAVELEPAPAKQPVRISLSRLNGRQHTPKAAPVEESAELTMRDVIKAASSGAGLVAGAGLNWNEAGKLLDSKLVGFNGTQYASAQRNGKHLRQEFSVLTIHKPLDDKMIVKTNDPMEIDAVLQHAMDERRLPQGSLVAAGGWCAPSEVIYDLCELEGRGGLFDLPEIGMARGGISRTLGPDFASIFGDVGFAYTEQDAIDEDWDGAGGGAKPCYEVECPDFEEIRMGVAGLCITAGLLQARGYPELLARVLRGALIAHDHKVSAALIQQVVAGSTAVNMSTSMAGLGALTPVLEAIDLQVSHLRNVNRIDDTRSLEAVFPIWVKGVIRADLALRGGVDLISVPDSRIVAWFRERGVSPQFVYNWQDLTGAPGTFTKWPNTVQFLLYPSGTWVKGASDVINMDSVYDSMQLGQNKFTALFSEEGFVAAKMCHDSRVVTVPVCRNGATGESIGINCATGAVAP